MNVETLWKWPYTIAILDSLQFIECTIIDTCERSNGLFWLSAVKNILPKRIVYTYEMLIFVLSYIFEEEDTPKM